MNYFMVVKSSHLSSFLQASGKWAAVLKKDSTFKQTPAKAVKCSDGEVAGETADFYVFFELSANPFYIISWICGGQNERRNI